MTKHMRCSLAMVAVGVWLLLPTRVSFADDERKSLSAEWWQWALSIPPAVNPLLDATGADCMVGQRGPVWFLAGTFGASTARRSCAIPEDTELFFPVVNSVSINAPNVCGQGPENDSVATLRAQSAAFIDGVTKLSVELDHRPVRFRRIKSEVFATALPEDNLLDAPCSGLGNVPAGIYSPSVDDGYYATIHELEPGHHEVHFHAENPSQAFVLDVTYDLNVVRVLRK
jgi:hypothetical protein